MFFFFAALAASVYAPIFSLFNDFSIRNFITCRYMFPFAVSFGSAVSSALFFLSSRSRQDEKAGRRRPSHWAVVFCLFLVALVSASSYRWVFAQRNTFTGPAAAEGRFLMNTAADVLMVKTHPYPGNNYYENLDFFKRLRKGQAIPNVVYDVFAHIDDPTVWPARMPVYRYSVDERRIVEVTGDFLKRRAEYFSRTRKLPFSVKLRVRDGAVSYDLGPSDRGRYFALLGYRPGLYCLVGDSGQKMYRRVFTSLKTFLRFGWESPEGWVTFSPEWFVDFSKQREIVWEQ